MFQLECFNWNVSIEAYKKKVTNQMLIKMRKKSKEAVFIVGDSLVKINAYLLTKSISHKFLVKIRPLTTARTIDMYDHLKLLYATSILPYLSCLH